MNSQFSQSQLKKLSERLRRAEHLDIETLDSLGTFRRLHLPALVDTIKRSKAILPDSTFIAGRLKNTGTIIEKLRREKTNLHTLRDLAGVRIVLKAAFGLGEQDLVGDHLREIWPDAKRIDRRIKPSHGYRALHLEIRAGIHLVEIQIRTSLQHSWAEVCENLADRWGRNIRYGEPPSEPERVVLPQSGSPSRREIIQTLKQLSDEIYGAELEVAKCSVEAQAVAESADDIAGAKIDNQQNTLNSRQSKAHQRLRDAQDDLFAMAEILTGDDTIIDTPSPDGTLHLVIYDRRTERRLKMETYDSDQAILDQWVKYDRQYASDSNIEIVLLSSDITDLRKTHRRYFEPPHHFVHE